MRIVEPAEHPAAKQTAGAKQRLIKVGGGAVDCADDLEAQKIGQHAVGEVKDRADLFAIVSAARHERRVRILKDNGKFAVEIGVALLSPEADEFGLGENAHRRGRYETEETNRPHIGFAA